MFNQTSYTDEFYFLLMLLIFTFTLDFCPFASYVNSHFRNHSALKVICKVEKHLLNSFRWGSWSGKFHSALHQPQQINLEPEMAWFNRNEAYVFDEELEDADEDLLRAMALVHSRGYAVVKMVRFPNTERNPLQTRQSVEIQTQRGEERLSSFGRPGVALNSPPMSMSSSTAQVERHHDVSPMEVEDPSMPTTSATSTTPLAPKKNKWTPAKKIQAPSSTPRKFAGKKATPGQKIKGAARKPASSSSPGDPTVPNIFGAAVPTQSSSPSVDATSTPRQGKKRRLNRTQRRIKREQQAAAASQQEAVGGEMLGAEGGEEEEEEELRGEEEEEEEAEAVAAESPAVPRKKLKVPDARVIIHKKQKNDRDVFNQLVERYKTSGEYQFLLQQSQHVTEEALRDRKAARGAVRGRGGRGRGRINRPPPLTQPIDYRALPHSDPQWKAENDAKYAELERIQLLQMEAARREYDSTTQFFAAPAPPRLHFSGKNIDTKIAATLDANRRNPIMNRAIMPAVSSTLPPPICPSTSPVQLPAYPHLTPEDLRRYADQLEQGDLFSM